MAEESKGKIVQCKLEYRTDKGTLLRSPVTLEFKDDRIFFLKSAFAFKDEIKAFAGAKWHAYDPKPRKIWSIDDSFRNQFNLHYLMGENVFAWFDRPLEHHSYSRPLMEHQKDMTDHGLTYHFQIWGAEMGTGKGGLPSTKVATPLGWTTLGEIKVGEKILNPDGGTTKVKGVFPRGRMEMFRVTFTDGSSTVCSGDHLWDVRTSSRKFRGLPYETLELNEIVKRGLEYGNGNLKHYKHYIPVVTPVSYQEQPLKVSPYLVGYLLGNGGLTGWTNVISIPDEETVDRLNLLMEIPLQRKKDSEIDYHIKDDVVNAFIKETGLKGKLSHEKHLPEGYLFNTFENRVELLQGLCDSDGHALETSGVEFSTTSPQLAEVFKTLVQSVGGTCYTSEKIPTYTYKGEELEGRLAYRIYASFPSSILPFRLGRKLNNYTIPTKYEPTRAITTVESIGEEECICISVEAENQLYVTDEFIVTHNTLSAQEVIERANVPHWYWVGPKTSLPNIKREFKKWGFDETCATIDFMTYERLVRIMDERSKGDPIPNGVIFDESSRCKTPSSQRSKAALMLANLIRSEYMWEGYVILMSGTPSPKRPTDWWSQAEIAWPGYLKEGSVKALEKRLAFQVQETFDSGTFWKTYGWRDNDRKCKTCGDLYEDGPHDPDPMVALSDDNYEFHKFVAAKNEVSFMFERLKGLTLIKHKKDCLTLPDKRYRKIMCKPKASLLRVGKTIVESAQNAMIGMTLLRELSDGFQYRDIDDGTKPCNHCEKACGEVDEWFNPEIEHKVYQDISLLSDDLTSKLEKRRVKCPKCHGTQQMKKTKRVTREVACPKEPALRSLLDECEETGRIVVFAGFTGSVDRCVRICQSEGWAVVRCDGRGFQVTLADGSTITDVEALDFWDDLENNPRVAFVAHPESGGMSLTLTASRMAVYWSNSFKPEYRVQSEDRIHRKGMDENLGCVIVDLLHLPTDERVVDIIRENRKLELMTMGKLTDDLNWETGTEGEVT